MTVTAGFRASMAALASAVYVVTGLDPAGRPRGFTATSVIPHTREPPTLIVSIDQSTFSHDALVGGDRFGLNVLAGDQRDEALLFASKQPDKFSRTDWRLESGIPILTRARGHSVCRILHVITHGDHTLVVGEVESAAVSGSDTLFYAHHRFLSGPSVPDPDTIDTRSPQMSTVATRPELSDLLSRAEQMLPDLRRRARQAEDRRTLPEETIDEMRRAGFFRLYQPARYGGYEMPWGAQVAISRVLGRACGSTAWIASVVATHSAMVGRMAGQAQDDVWAADPDALIATGSARIAGEAVPTDGGYLVGGAWRFASGIDHCRWVMVPVPVEGIDAEGPAAVRQCLLPASDYEIVDDWHVSGLGGTGSKQAAIPEPVFVPAHRTIGFLEMLGSRPPGADVNDAYVYRIEFRPYFGTLLLGPIIGTAEGALEDYLEGTRARIGAIFGDRIADSVPVQLRVAESSAEISGAALMVDRMLETLHARGAADEALTPDERVLGMRDRAFVARRCVDAVHRLVRQMGASGLADSNPVQRHFRDVSAMAAQIGLNWDRNAGTYGKWALGIPTGDRAIDGDTTTRIADSPDSVA